MKSKGFPPVARPDARFLILGSLPGAMSLAKQEYYAKPQNQFWRIMGALAGARPDLPYAERLECLMKRRIALWDVCAAALREGSLDSAIRDASPNDFAGFFHVHAHIERICFNGAKAAELYTRKVLPTLPAAVQAVPRFVLPSTSPAHASRPFEEKLLAWQAALLR